MKPGYFVGILIALLIIGEHFLKNKHSTTKEIFIIVIAALVAGAFAGFALEWALSLFRTFMQANVGDTKFIKDVTMIAAGSDEELIFQTGANHFKGWEAVGGKLYLTNKQLIFKSHNLNFQNHELLIPLSNIGNIRRFKAYRLVNTGMVIETKENQKERFLVDDIEECYALLSQSVNQLIKT